MNGAVLLQWCSVRAKDGLIHRCWRRDILDAEWYRVCRYAIAVTHTIAIVDDPEGTAPTCLWCIRGSA